MARQPNTRTSAEDVPAFIQSMHQAVNALSRGPTAEGQPTDLVTYEPAVSARRSLASPDHIVSMIDGKPYKMLKRHLSRHGLTPAQYCERYNLKPDYPMTAKSYSDARSAVARALGLGRKPETKVKSTKSSPHSKLPVRQRAKRGAAKTAPDAG